MAKGNDEIASEILQEIIKAKASIIATASQIDTKKQMIEEHLGNDAVTETFKKIYLAVVKPID
ncbi:hypothetical protein ACN6KS_22700 [Paenibacillus nitricinens]|uniref:hypothetical protein n=1 Tax=Paenibacillus nitricinens TaxID=3367691 RepID=UPI003F875E62